VITGLGKIVVGLVPDNTHIVLHTLAALNVSTGNIATLLLSLAIHRERQILALLGFGLFGVGISATALSIAAPFAGPSLLLGFGVGGTERLADYPACVWLALVGIAALSGRQAQSQRVRNH
jgi:hypothetical protein